MLITCILEHKELSESNIKTEILLGSIKQVYPQEQEALSKYKSRTTYIKMS